MLALLWSTWASYLLCSLTYIKIIYIYVREQSKQDAHVHGVHNITSKKLNTSFNKAPIHLINVDASKLVILII